MREARPRRLSNVVFMGMGQQRSMYAGLSSICIAGLFLY
jgi:hypothetical protein